MGTNVPDGEELSRNVSPAGNRFQNNVIKNLRSLGHRVHNLSFTTDGKSRGEVLRDIPAFRKELKRYAGKAHIAMCYDILWPWLDLPGIMKRAGSRSMVLMADLSGPECFESPHRKAYAKAMIGSLSHFDTVVGLSENVKRYMRPGQGFIYVPGGIDREFYDAFESPFFGDADGTFTAVFSGLMSPVTGADLAISSMEINKDPDLRLVMTGRGELEGAVKAASEKDPRIIYKGLLPYDEYMKVLKGADVLLNPRRMSLPENQNNFPSKFMEYLGSGRPVISTGFAGWEHFEDNSSWCSESPEDLARAVAAEKEERCRERTEAIFENNRRAAKEYLWEDILKKVVAG
ncbi:MAG: glycosyltransferase family 4 protein [Lachnospiraceae bacterium]|nr:glycosyltransferase family 4 protein [Lachnospiraceae bacterium]